MNSAPKAVVVGAGIGGLCVAAGLIRIGWRVRVLERSPRPREVGAGMSLMVNARRALDQLGVGAEVRARSATMMPGGQGVRLPSGRRLMPGADADFVAEHGLSAIVLLRRDLQDVLLSALTDGCLRTGARVTDVRWDPAGGPACVVYHTDEGTRTIEGDLVVGADGVNSRIRSLLQPDAHPPVYSGHSVWRGISECTMPDEPGGNTWGRGRQFGRMPLRDGRVYWYAVANTPLGQSSDDELGEVRRRFGTWHDPIPALLDSTPGDTVLHHDVFELDPPLSSYVSGCVALLGDAAHAMTSDIGQGACQSIEDAVVLCAALAEQPDVSAALARYDEQRRPRAQMIVEASRRMGELTMRERRWQVLARNAMVRMVPRRSRERALAAVGDWQPPVLA
ncbi:2-polyprenyl-6-methoxyphenol hydroxylase-like FAD-dependent oxidoreductase [Kibdelosporangium banguiense]|uniref:2-polyprenyl-6-methoxyphenol hydroxylase-like FAD-dependent oxidoreductase n=1 Tax=Kibdelosporangium banguiense TaxID=1365924 RepID=A0ABS4TS99_9PSEU|nr:FAD-dependent monooxygenase [Kibdelosporangium banguiense]MBP2327282.1 2-polyprenyl-6-methoxyphenol hydroxylase-like FAD-dependent oxidoreductase [Kibdelosporangium banguiense]